MADHDVTSRTRYRARRALTFALALICLIGFMIAQSRALKQRAEVEETTFQLTAPATEKSVLLIESYGENNPSVPLERRGVLDVLRTRGVTVDVEYMDTRNYPIGYAASDSWRDMIRARLTAHGPYNAVICADDDALHAVDAIHDELFAGTPVVFFSVNDVAYGQAVAGEGWATGIVEHGHVEQILLAAAHLEPDARNLVVITDDSALGRASLAQFEEARAQLPGYTERIISASSMSRKSLARALEDLGDNDIVFQLAAYSDKNGNGYTLDETNRFVTRHCHVPVFRESGAGVGSGITGASYVDYEGQGRRAAELAWRVMGGADPADIPVETDEVTSTVFDLKAVEDHGLDRDLVRDGAYLVNDPDPRAAAQPFILSVILLAAGVALVCYFVSLGNRRMREDAAAIAASRDDLDYQLRHDTLTGLPNRLALAEKAAGVGPDDPLSLVSLDLDGFADLNDSYGHDVGDQAIQALAARMRDRLTSPFIARSGGDEFALIFDHPLTADSEELVLLRKLIGDPMEAGGFTLTLTASVGAVNREPGMSVEEMVRCADLAMADAKAAIGRTSLAFYNDAMRLRLEERIRITTCLRHAIDADGFTMVYQPQVETATRHLVGVEALVRLAGGEYGPGQFIPVAEGAGLVVDIGRIVTRKVVGDLAAWIAAGREPVPVSINFSAAQLRDVGYLDYLAALLEERDIDPRLIKIEITESLMLENEAAGAALCEQVHAAGMHLALDDFGTGYSSLARMAQLPMDDVKLDKSLVDEFLIEGSEGFVDDITHLVHGLGKTIVVEGVETESQYGLARRLGCDVIQGYYFSRPVAPSDLATFAAQLAPSTPMPALAFASTSEAPDPAPSSDAATVSAPIDSASALPAPANPASSHASSETAPGPAADLASAVPGPDHGPVTDATDDPQTESDQSPYSA